MKSRTLARWSLALGLWSGLGCSVHRFAVPEPLAETVCECETLPADSRCHVYVFFLQGCDVLDCANLEGVKEYVQNLGFHKAWFGYPYHVKHMHREIVRIRHGDAQARFVIVAHGAGGEAARRLADSVHGEGVFLDCLIYLGGRDKSGNTDEPENVGKILRIQGGPKIEHTCGGPIEEHYLGNVGSKGVVTHPASLDLLVQVLTALASQVPGLTPPLEPYEHEEPRPRTMPLESADRPRDEWDFLRPESDTVPIKIQPRQP